MIERERQSESPDPIVRREVPLRLVDDESEGSTDAIQIDEGAHSEASAASGAASASAAFLPEASRSGSAADAESGTSTGGFDTLLGKLVVQAGFATHDELDACTQHLQEAAAQGEPSTLGELLVRKDYVTRHQLDRLRQEFEAKKSGRRIPGYSIIRKLGSGAMATVFLAKQLSLDRPVAIKILPRKFSDNEKFIERFYKEGRAAAQLNHANIVGAYDVGRAGEHHFFVMEYVDGDTVYDRIIKHKRMPEKTAIDIVRQVARALEHAHERGFVHRDIKPKNIMITKSGTVKLADLGLARAMSDQDAAKAEAGRAYGTPYYISPEQIRGEMKIGPAADLYGLGATFYHMVTGRVPFEGKNPSAVMHKHLKAPLVPPDHLNPDLTAGCAQVIEMMMAKKQSERYHNASDLLEDIELVAKGEPPHFAHRTLDHKAISETITAVASAPGPIAVAKQESDKSMKITESPMFMIMIVMLVLSVLVNAILIALLAS